MFYLASTFAGDLSDWDLPKVTDMNYLFYAAESFNSDLSKWDVSNVSDMSFMFNGAFLFNADVSGWDVSKVTNMSDMFHFASFDPITPKPAAVSARTRTLSVDEFLATRLTPPPGVGPVSLQDMDRAIAEGASRRGSV